MNKCKDSERGRELSEQARFLQEKVPFYATHYRDIQLQGCNDWHALLSLLPPVDRRDLIKSSPLSFLGERDNSNPLLIHRGTGGTTGFPLSIFYSEHDWRAAVDAHCSAFREAFGAIEDRPIAFNSYSQVHISGPIFSEAIVRSGGLAINRSLGQDDERALKDIERHRCNVLIGPPTSSKKGGSIEDLLEVDAASGKNYINGLNIKCIIVSSTGLTPYLIQEIRDLGIKNIVNCYGSTEVMPVAFSCPSEPEEFHVVGASTYGEVVDSSYRRVSSGERGRVLVGRLFGVDEKGKHCRSTSTALLNYLNGDEATLLESKCRCGKTGIRLGQVKRIVAVADKSSSGCQVMDV